MQAEVYKGARRTGEDRQKDRQIRQKERQISRKKIRQAEKYTGWRTIL